MDLSSEDVKKIISEGSKTVGELLLKSYKNTINQEGVRAFNEAIQIGIQNTVSSLYDADVDDMNIICILNKYWGINRDEAIKLIAFEKKNAPVRELKTYLKLNGYSSKEIIEFVRINGSKIRHHNELWALKKDPEKLKNELEKL